uniref:Type-1 angiotensin II receptor-associated protein n=1 Tax=Plectus sambesii TaxID=2011161 RepID=A0A914UTZ2_9BILA
MSSQPYESSNPSFPFDILPRNLDHQAMLRAVFACHFILTSIALLGTWPSIAYVFYNAFFLAGLLWASTVPAANSELPLLKCLFVDGVAVALDILVMCSSYGADSLHERSGFEGFALFAAIVQLLLRPLTLLVLLRIRNERMRLRYENWDDQLQNNPADHHGFDGPSVASTVGGYSIGSYETPPARGYVPPAYFDQPSVGDDTKPSAP